ncbi:hypothetical protein E2562_039165 [Oryza meyeriana var. granulata]|uniref:DUF6598 domain-containing protein n=1 Tax=Oryza meyeriana var. granulata TaxID=110450 RepID=A0A6G1CMF6_9ORYZ|nr:hypothetical protein E2562_039165 [Oryza meyeriana var. granulata]
MADTDERWRATVIDVGGDADAARERNLPTTTTRRLLELAWGEEKARTVVVDLVGSQRPTECERLLCPSPCSDDIPSRHGSGSGEMGHMDERCARDIKHGIMSAAEKMKPELEPERGTNCNEELKCGEEKVVETKLELKPKPSKNWNEELTWEGKVVEVLHIVRRWEFTEFDPKLEWFVPTRLCAFNIAFFDHDKESKAGLGPPIHSLTSSDYRDLETSVNVISIKVVESDVGYPISIFGTVLARDQRGRDDPQIITSPAYHRVKASARLKGIAP